MNVMLDTNIILDDLLSREPGQKYANRIMELKIDKKIFGHITTNSLTDIYYVVEKHLNEVIAREAIRKIIKTFRVIAVDVDDCSQALDMIMKDFEDALAVTCAKKAELDYIITNDKEFLNCKDILVPSISPSDFIRLVSLTG